MTNATRVAGVLEVEIDVKGNLSHEVVEDMFKRAIAAAVELPVRFVVKLEVSEINRSVPTNLSLSEVNGTSQTSLNSGIRRLEAIQTKWFEVAYEVIVPSYLDADTIVERANRIAVPGSEESQLFRDVLMATDGVERVGEIVARVPASKVGGVTTAGPSSLTDEDKISWKRVVIGLSVAIAVVACLGISAVLIKRKMVTGDTYGQLGADIENGHLNPVNSLSQAGKDAVQEAPKPTEEVKASVFDANAAPGAQADKFADADDVVLVEIPASKGKERIAPERIAHL